MKKNYKYNGAYSFGLDGIEFLRIYSKIGSNWRILDMVLCKNFYWYFVLFGILLFFFSCFVVEFGEFKKFQHLQMLKINNI